MKDRISDEELDTLVMAYQDGSTDAAEMLVERYDGYFQKFLNVLKFRFNINDRTERGFVKYFIKSEEARENVTMFRKSDYIRRVIYSTMVDIQVRYKMYEPDELKNEMVIIFLSMAAKHNFEAPFRLYIAGFFTKKFYKSIKTMGVDEERDEMVEVYLDEDEPSIAHHDEYDLNDSPRYFIHPTTPTDFDENWVNGYDCHEIFEDLSIYERRLLKWYYEWRTLSSKELPEDIFKARKRLFKKTEEDIANLLGCSRKTINIKRNDVKRKLEQLSKEIHLIEG
jgi:hypothetical protein